MENSIVLENVSKSFKKANIINNISFSVTEGDIFGLLGPSGCGKTTTVKLISGILKPDSGNIKVLETEMPDFQVMSQIGYMAQAAALYTTLTAQENLIFFGKLYGLSGTALKDRISYVSEIVDLKNDLNKTVKEYSGGMLQRLSLAVSLISDPKVLILDEPTVGIDPLLRVKIWKELKILSANGTTILLTTHVMDEANKCNRLAMMRHGVITAIGTPGELIKNSGKDTMEDAFIYYGGTQYED